MSRAAATARRHAREGKEPGRIAWLEAAKERMAIAVDLFRSMPEAQEGELSRAMADRMRGRKLRRIGAKVPA